MHRSAGDVRRWHDLRIAWIDKLTYDRIAQGELLLIKGLE